MKNTVKILFLLLTVGLAACSNPSKKLIGRWKIDDVKLDIPQMKNAPDSMRVMFEGMMKGMIDQLKSTAFMEFKDGGKYEAQMGPKSETGTWSVIDDGKKLVTKMDNGGKSDTIPYEVMGDGKVKMTLKNPEGSMELIMAKAEAKK